jgi:magnesium transporter
MKIKLNQYILEDIENKDQPSEFINMKEYSVLVLRLPYIKDDIVDIVSYAFYIKETEIFIFNREKKEFEVLGDFNSLHNFLDIRIDKILSKISKLHIEIAKMEDSVYDGDYSEMNRWLLLKKDLGIIERVMAHAELAYEKFERKFKESIDMFAYEDLKEHINRILRLAIAGNEKLDYIYQFYRGRVDEKMNNVMFVLTILSAIFMPLTLVTGFFGMNTGGLPFVNDNIGTLKVVVLTIVFEIPFVWYIFKLAKFDKIR